MAVPADVLLKYSSVGSEVRDYQVSKEEILIGRADECDIPLDDKEVSRYHASLKVT
jgi:pSer/pThr/pTyr-binding forkhead associated (FHA) protein